MANILVLGAGFVAEPLVEYLTRRSENNISIGSYLLEEAEQLASNFSRVQSLQIDVTNGDVLNDFLRDFDLVVSLVPAPFHPVIAKAAIATKTSMVTASYESNEMRALAEDAKQAGIIILNEIGLDPGIDHLSAMQIIDEAHENNEDVEAFISWCGGLPAPEHNDNPLGYKFSWAPKGVLMALLNEARYLHDNKAVEVNSDQLLDWTKPLEVAGLELEGYPNRESISYKGVYGIQNASSILRGTLRYQGFSEIIKGAHQLNLLSTKSIELEESANLDWKSYVDLINKEKGFDSVIKTVNNKSVEALSWLGCFSERHISPKTAPIDVFCELLVERLQYLQDESDMVVLQHKFVLRKPSGEQYYKSSTLKAIGDPNSYSAMSKTVGYPAAIASQLIVDNLISEKGLLLPVTKPIYEPILKALQGEGIDCIEQEFDVSDITKEKFLSELYSTS